MSFEVEHGVDERPRCQGSTRILDAMPPLAPETGAEERLEHLGEQRGRNRMSSGGRKGLRIATPKATHDFMLEDPSRVTMPRPWDHPPVAIRKRRRHLRDVARGLALGDAPPLREHLAEVGTLHPLQNEAQPAGLLATRGRQRRRWAPHRQFHKRRKLEKINSRPPADVGLSIRPHADFGRGNKITNLGTIDGGTDAIILTSARTWVQMSTKIGGFGPLLADVGPLSADVLPNLANIGETSTEVGSASTKIAPSRPEWVEICQKMARSGQHR